MIPLFWVVLRAPHLFWVFLWFLLQVLFCDAIKQCLSLCSFLLLYSKQAHDMMHWVTTQMHLQTHQLCSLSDPAGQIWFNIYNDANCHRAIRSKNKKQKRFRERLMKMKQWWSPLKHWSTSNAMNRILNHVHTNCIHCSMLLNFRSKLPKNVCPLTATVVKKVQSTSSMCPNGQWLMSTHF